MYKSKSKKSDPWGRIAGLNSLNLISYLNLVYNNLK